MSRPADPLLTVWQNRPMQRPRALAILVDEFVAKARSIQKVVSSAAGGDRDAVLSWPPMSRRARIFFPALACTALVTALGSTSFALAQPVEGLAAGRLLVAREGLTDPNFSRTVVLLVSYGESGAMGVVLNRPSHMRLQHLLPHLQLPSESNVQIHVGGPVAIRQATILSNTDDSEHNQSQVFGKVKVSGDLGLLERMVTEPRPGEQFRVYAGHAGWAPGQLEAEVERLGWHVFPATEAIVFADGEEDLWEVFVRRSRTRVAQR